MGNQLSQVPIPSLSCCTERMNSNKGQMSSNGAPVGRPVKASEANGAIPDIASRFDVAVRNRDLMELVKLLSSTHKLGKDVMATQHPWAEQPQTIGALAAVHLAVLANDPNIRTRIRAAGALPILVSFLNTNANTRDRVHSAVVALSFISIDNEDNCREIYRCGAMPLLVPLMSAQPEGLGFASSSVCRNLYVKNRNGREEFVNLGGLKSMVSLLQFQPNRANDAAYMDGVFETVSNFRDLIEPDAKTRESGGRLAKRALKDGLLATLEALRSECTDNDVKDEAKLLTDALVGFSKAEAGQAQSS